MLPTLTPILNTILIMQGSMIFLCKTMYHKRFYALLKDNFLVTELQVWDSGLSAGQNL